MELVVLICNICRFYHKSTKKTKNRKLTTSSDEINQLKKIQAELIR